MQFSYPDELVHEKIGPGKAVTCGAVMLWDASREGNNERVTQLLNLGVDIDSMCNMMPPIIAATEACQFETIKLLVDRGCKIDALNEYDGTTALCLAALCDEPEICLFLISRGADATIADYQGYSALANYGMFASEDEPSAGVLSNAARIKSAWEQRIQCVSVGGNDPKANVPV